MSGAEASLLSIQTALLHAQEADCRARAGASCADPRCHFHVHRRGCGGAYIKVLLPAREATAHSLCVKSSQPCSSAPSSAPFWEAAAHANHAPAGLQISEPAAFTERQDKKRKRQWGHPKFATETGAPSPAAGSKGAPLGRMFICFPMTCNMSIVAGMLLCLPRAAPRQLWCLRDMERSTNVVSREGCLILAPQIEAIGACMLQAGSPWRTSSAVFGRRRMAGSTRRSRAAQRSRHSRPRRGGHRGLGRSSPRRGVQGLSRRRIRRRGGTACCKLRCSASAAWCCHSMLLLFHVNLVWCPLHHV